MILKVYKTITKGYGMLGKVLGIVTAGVFVGAAVVEISGYMARRRADEKDDRKPPPEAVDHDEKKNKEHDAGRTNHAGDVTES